MSPSQHLIDSRWHVEEEVLGIVRQPVHNLGNERVIVAILFSAFFVSSFCNHLQCRNVITASVSFRIIFEGIDVVMQVCDVERGAVLFQRNAPAIV